MYVGKVLEEDGEDRQDVHTWDNSTLGMTPPMVGSMMRPEVSELVSF